MKKFRLMLLALLVPTFSLASCEAPAFLTKIFPGLAKDEKKKTNDDDTGDDEGEEEEEETYDPVDMDDFTISFADKDIDVTTYVDVDTPMTFEYEGATFGGIDCYETDTYLMMRNKKNNGEGQQPTYAKKLAYFTNKSPFVKPIKKVEVVLNSGDKVSENCVIRVNILSSCPKAAVTTGGASGNASKTEEVTVSTTSTANDGYFFAVSTNKKGNNSYNGQLLSVSVSF